MEEWKDILGYEGYYQVSNLGQIRSIAHYQGKWGKVYKRRNPHILRQTPTKDGYLAVMLSYFGKDKRILVHRIVAQNWIPNPEQKPCINHKDENKMNNAANNLEWCTPKYNINYGHARLKMSRSMTNCSSVSKPIMAVHKSGKKQVFQSMNEASRQLHISWCRIRRSALRNVLVPHTDIKFQYI